MMTRFYFEGSRPADSRTAVISAARESEAEAKRAAPIERTSPEKAAALEAILATMPGTVSDVQEARLLEVLTAWPVSSFEAMRHLDIYHSAARVMCLRKQDHQVTMVWIKTPTESGELHRIGQYMLKRASGA